MSDPVAVYSDGGVVNVNPSPIAGMWATCHVDADDTLVWSASGVVLADPDDDFLSLVTNNQTEFRALLAGLEALPDGWSGTVYCDSLVTIRRFRDDARVAGIPYDWRKRMAYVLGRLGALNYVLLDGHPTRAQLAAGVGKRGNPVSKWNVWCDEACTAEGRKISGQAPKRKRKGTAA